MRNTLITLLITLFMVAGLTAQVKIGENPQNIDPASVLELESTDKVLVITRVTTAQMNAIVPSQGALCYNTELQAVHYFNGTQWVNIGGGGGTGGPLTTDPIVNDVSTIVITQTATGDNLEVAPNSISSLQIIDGGVNGIDIQDGSIGPGKLQNNSVTEEKLSENSVGAFALDNDNIGVSAFNNDVGYITAGNLLSSDLGNDLQLGATEGLFYDDEPLNTLIQNNTDAINSLGIPNLNEVLQQGANALNLKIEGLADPTNPADATHKDYVDMAIANAISAGGGNPNDELIQSGELIGNNIVINEGVGANAQQITIDVSALGGSGGNNNTGFTIANDSLNITDGGGTFSVPLSGLGSAGGSDNSAFTIANDSLNITDGGGTFSVPLSDLSTPNTAFEIVDDSLHLQDAAGNFRIALADIAAATGGSNNTQFNVTNDSLRITDGDGTLSVHLDTLTHKGAPKAIFYAGLGGKPTTADDNANVNDDGGFYWDPDGRDLNGVNKYGALFVGLEGRTQSNIAKVQIADNYGGSDPNWLGFALQVQNYSGSPTGILFSTATNTPTNYGKGALMYDNSVGGARGDFHFLQNDVGDDSFPLIADKAFTIKNNKDIVLYGGIEIDGTATGTGLGTTGQVLSSTGTGLLWVNAGTATTDTDASDGLSNFTAGSGYNINVDDTTIEINTDALRIKPGVIDMTTPVEQILSTTTAGVVGWRDIPSGGSIPMGTAGSIFFSDGAGGLVEDAAQISFDDTGNRLNLGGGFIAQEQKLNVNGGVRASEYVAASNTTNPSYRFFDDPDTGLKNTGVDELALVAGAQEMITLDFSVGNGNVAVINASVELEEELIDITGNAGSAGQVLTSTGAGVAWSEPVIFSMGKINPGGTDNINGATLMGSAGNYTITFNTARPDADYIIQLTVSGDNRIFVTNQTINGFEVSLLDSAGNPVTSPLPIWYYTVSDF